MPCDYSGFDFGTDNWCWWSFDVAISVRFLDSRFWPAIQLSVRLALANIHLRENGLHDF
jgi:hypothetical protein